MDIIIPAISCLVGIIYAIKMLRKVEKPLKRNGNGLAENS